MRKVTLLAGAMLLAAPLFAADTGWFIGLDTTLGSQTGNDVVLANTTDGNRNPNGLVKLSTDSKVTPRLYGGYRMDFGTVALSVSTSKYSGTTTAYDSKGYLLLSFGSPWNDSYRANGVWAKQESKGHAIDLTFSRDIVKTDKSNFEWMLGLREWKLENTVWANACRDIGGVSCLAQSATANPYNNAQNVTRENSDSHGIGLTLGLKGHYKFNDRFSAASWVRFGLLHGTASLSNQDEAYYGAGPQPARCDNTANSYCSDFSYGSKRTFQQIDLGGKLIVNFVAGFDGYIGYTFSSYQDGVTSLDYTINGGYGYGPAIRTRTVGTDGVLLGVSYRF